MAILVYKHIMYTGTYMTCRTCGIGLVVGNINYCLNF